MVMVDVFYLERSKGLTVPLVVVESNEMDNICICKCFSFRNLRLPDCFDFYLIRVKDINNNETLSTNEPK